MSDMCFDKTDWRIANLGSVVKFISGGTPKKDEERYWNGTVPWVSSGEMCESRIYETRLNVTEDGVRNGTKLAPKNSIFVVVRGMSLAKEFRVSLAMREMTYNQDVKAIYPSKNIDPIFLFYYLKSQSNPIRDSTSEAAHGTKKLDMPVLEQWPVPLPPLAAQKKIAAILSAYDDLIENNKRRIALLENMAEEIYREWFVRFRFPGYKTAEFEKGVPKGWQKVIFRSACKFEKGKNPEEVLEENGENFVCYVNVGALTGSSDSFAKIQKNSVQCQVGDILMLMDGSRSGLTFRANVNGIVGSTLSLIRVEGNMKNYVFEYLKAMHQEIVFNNTGSAIPHANKDYINRMIFFIPCDESLLIKFNEMYDEKYRIVENLKAQNINLSKTKDKLLPRLISGKLSVEDLDIQFPPSMQNTAKVS